jgi:sterol desaturase/sphingolipid hydroxylase (fatty acid hydroxylase superfamily)
MTQFWYSMGGRLSILVLMCGGLWSLESIIPLYVHRTHRLKHAATNVTLTVIFVLTNAVLSFGAAGVAGYAVRHRVGVFVIGTLSPWAQVALGIIALDLFAYLAHVSMHHSALGWRLHRVHHSERIVDVTTAFRQHPGETAWRLGWNLVAIVALGIPLWVVIVATTIAGLAAQIAHANIRFNDRLDRLVRVLFVTPPMHKVHHSREQAQTNSNYANVLSVWDRVFGTYTGPLDFHSLRYGLDGFDDERQQDWAGLLGMPFSPQSRAR